MACGACSMKQKKKWHPQELPADVRFNNSVIHSHTHTHTHTERERVGTHMGLQNQRQ